MKNIENKSRDGVALIMGQRDIIKHLERKNKKLKKEKDILLAEIIVITAVYVIVLLSVWN